MVVDLLYEFDQQQRQPLSSKSRRQMLPVSVASPQQNQAVHAPTAAAETGAAVRRFWPSYIDQHVAQLDFDASVMMMTSAGDECNNDDDDDDDEEEENDEGENEQGDDDDEHVQQSQRQNGSEMARGGEVQQDNNIFDSNSSSMMMAMMMLDAGVAAAAAESAQLISTDSLDMEQLRVRCECNEHNANYKLTFDEDSGQWTTSGIGGSFTTTATASPPVMAVAAQHQQQKQLQHHHHHHHRRLKQQEQQQLKQLLGLNNNNNDDNNDNDNDDENGGGHDGERHQQQLYTAILHNNGGLGLQLLEQLNNDDDANTFNQFSAGKRVTGRPATSVGHGTAATAEWRKNSFMDELLNNQNNNCTSSPLASSQCHGGGAVTKRGTEMMTTWGRLQQGDMGTQQPFNSDKVHSLPELNSTDNRQKQQQDGGRMGTQQFSTATTTFAKGASTPAMATTQQQVQAVHGGALAQSSSSKFSVNGGPEQQTNNSGSSSSSITGARRPTSSLVDNFIAGRQQRQRGGSATTTTDHEYSETYLGNGRYIDMNENEIGYVPSCTASVQRRSGGGGGGGEGVGDPLHHQLQLLDLDLRRRELLGECDHDGGQENGEQIRRRQRGGQLNATKMMTMPIGAATSTTASKKFNSNNNRHKLYEIGDGTPTTMAASRSSNNCNGTAGVGNGDGDDKATTAATMHRQQQQQRRTFADLCTSRTVPDLKFIALAHNVPSICPPSSVSLDNLLCRVRNSGDRTAGGGGSVNNATIDELIDCCASSMRIISEADGGASDGPDSGLGSSHSDGPSHIEDWSSLSVLLPRNVLEACSFFKTNSFLLTGSSNNIEGRRPAVPPPRSFTSAAIWRLKEKVNFCLRHGHGGTNTDPSTPTCAAAASCCCAGGGNIRTTLFDTDFTPRHAEGGQQCCTTTTTKSAVFARQQSVSSSALSSSPHSRAVLSQKLRLHARELALIGLPIYDQKRAIIERVVEGVAEIIRGASSVVLMKALERLLGDELLPGVRMWHVICTVTGPGPVTRNVYQLIQQLEASEKPDHSRVGHFFRGLLTLHSLDGWLSYVVLKEHVLRPFYAPSAFLIGAQTAYRSLYWRLVECVELLSVLNQCGEAGKRWERRQQQKPKQRLSAATIVNNNNNDGVVAGIGIANASSASMEHQQPTTATGWRGAARLPKDSRVPKSSSVPTKLMTATTTTTIKETSEEDRMEEEEREHEVEAVQKHGERMHEVEAVQQHGKMDRQQQQQQNCIIEFEDDKSVEAQQAMEEDEMVLNHVHHNLIAVEFNSDNIQSPKEGNNAAVVHTILRPSRIPILRTRSRSSTMHSNGSPTAPQLHSPTSSRRSSSARPTPPSNSSSPVCICPVREAVVAGERDQSPPFSSSLASGTMLFPLREGECVRVLFIRGAYTRCSRLPEQQQQQQQQRLTLQNGVVPTRTLQFGKDGGDEQQRHDKDGAAALSSSPA